MNEERFRTFEEFWPFYLGEHSHKHNRAMHFFGIIGALILLGAAAATGQWLLFFAAPIFGYACAWIGHFIIEKNRPATFSYPLWSLRGDLRMFRLMLFRKI